MGRKILAVIVALIVAFAVIMIVQMLNSLVVSPPSADVLNDPAELREFMGTLPMTAYIVVLTGYFLGSLSGGYIVSKMSHQEGSPVSLAILIGLLLTIGGILNFLVLLPGQPTWFAAAALVIYIPVTLLGHKLAN